MTAPGAFELHLAEAIALNRARRPLYARRTRGRSRLLSDLLIGLERLSVPLARFLDRRARPFQARGVPIVAEDFVSMRDVRPAEAPPPLRGRTSRAGMRRLRAALAGYVADVRRAARGADFEAAAETSRAVLAEIEALERADGAHLVMSRHIVESIGLAAANAPRWAAMSGGDTVGLSRQLVTVQVMGVGLAPTVDALAHPLHGLGAGILVNDIPPIPFPAPAEAPLRA